MERVGLGEFSSCLMIQARKSIVALRSCANCWARRFHNLHDSLSLSKERFGASIACVFRGFRCPREAVPFGLVTFETSSDSSAAWLSSLLFEEIEAIRTSTEENVKDRNIISDGSQCSTIERETTKPHCPITTWVDCYFGIAFVRKTPPVEIRGTG